MKNIAFHGGACAQFSTWAKDDRKLFARLIRLIGEAAREPFGGIGKPEPLRHQLKGYWSRRINEDAPADLRGFERSRHHHFVPGSILSL